ncbi:MAG TPA: M48 family metallopeptidase [Marinobacter sp.]|nr:M48 family metallopeptidase [Marinobacter sp.]
MATPNPGFFERQAHARRNTGLLVVLFLTAVALITLAVCLVGYAVTRSESTSLPFQYWLLTSHGLITAGGVIALISVGSLIRWAALAGGGSKVAEMVSARPIEPDTRDPQERILRNIVEEMAIASGVPVPSLYVMDNETGINAFVAGYTPGEAVMVVTHGALTQLSRDELQGVVGHEFSHILNGDMRINVRLIALLAGILMIGQIGHFLLRAGFYSGGRHRSRDGRAQAAIGLVGLALMVIGYVGVFFGRLIQSAVSRQREMLADASAVQFTRNPEGIGGALFKIGVKGGYLDTTSHASDMNHMCFTESARMKFASLLASHPPIDERIQAIQPGLMARLRSRLRDTQPLQAATPGSAQSSATVSAVSELSGAVSASTSAISARSRAAGAVPARGLSSQVGKVSDHNEAYATQLLAELPATFRTLLNTRSGAIQLCYGLLVHEVTDEERHKRLAGMDQHGLLGVNTGLLDKLLPTIDRLGADIRFPALELAMPALRKLDPEERAALLDNVRLLIHADNRLSLFEHALASFLNRHLAPEAAWDVPVRYRQYRAVLPELALLFSLFARAGTDHPDEASALYREALASFGEQTSVDADPLPRVTLPALQQSLERLSQLSPLMKPAVIDACAHCVSHDGRVAAKEYELMRLVADQLNCPMPPL